MSKIAITPNVSGTGTFTIAAPDSNTDRTLTLPDAAGSVVLNEGSGTFKIDASGNVGIGTSSPASPLHVSYSAAGYSSLVNFRNTDTGTGGYAVATFAQSAAGSATGIIGTGASAASNSAFQNKFTVGTQSNHAFTMVTNDTERLRIDTAGRVTMPYQPAFLTRTQGSSYTGGWAKFTGFTTDTYNIGGHWSLASQRFTAPIAGRYAFYVGGWMNGNAPDARFGYNFQVNGGAQTYICGGSEAATDTPLPAGFVVFSLAASDYVDLGLFLAGGTRQMGTSSHAFYYGGYLIG